MQVKSTFRARSVMTVVLLLLVVANEPVSGAVVGPEQVPSQLTGLWRVCLCVSNTHAWIRFESAETGEVHTVSRYIIGCGGIYDPFGRRRHWPCAPVSGVIWDMDLKYELGLRNDGRVLRCCYVWNPRIYRGRGNGYGHFMVRMNCVTFARDAWSYYTGEYYRLPPIATPGMLERKVSGG